MMKKFGVLLGIALLLVAVPASAGFALPVVAQLQDVFTAFDGGPDTVTVKSTVYQFGSDYIYGYEILTGTVDVSWLSIEILPGAVLSSAGYDFGPGQAAFWSPVGTPIVSMDAFFTTPQISAGNSSQMVWFISPQEWTRADGATGGITDGTYVTTRGTILTPIPEPATLAIFGIGALLSLRCRRRI